MAEVLKATQVRHSYPERPQFQEFMKPCRFEGTINALEVRGVIPAEIDGTFYRVRPDPQLPPFIENDPVDTIPQTHTAREDHGKLTQ